MSGGVRKLLHSILFLFSRKNSSLVLLIAFKLVYKDHSQMRKEIAELNSKTLCVIIGFLPGKKTEEAIYQLEGESFP
jgi:hypothetical protein